MSNTEIAVLFAVGVLFALHWIVHGLRRKSLETRVLRALESVQNAERHWQSVLLHTNAPAYVEVQLTFLGIERHELNGMLEKIRVGKKVSFDWIYRLEKLVAEHAPGNPINFSAAPNEDNGVERTN